MRLGEVLLYLFGALVVIDGTIDVIQELLDHNLTCARHEFDCRVAKNGYSRCIPHEKVCDGKQDCINNYDEEECKRTYCPPGFMLCNSGKCIPLNRICDGVNDCPDGGDENDCGKLITQCFNNHYQCQNDRCIPRTDVCNGVKDCEYGEDEVGCPPDKELGMCNRTHFMCDRTCNPSDWLCNGIIQCEDQSDENTVFCGSFPECPEGHFRCLDGLCKPISRLCDRIADCEDKSDEGDICNKCRQGECKTNCNKFIRELTPDCKCDKDEWLDLNNGECINTNKCLDPRENVCNHICVPVDSGFKCRCHDHFILDADGFTCHAKRNPKSALFVATDQHIMKFTSYAFGTRIKNSVFFENQRLTMKIVSIAYNPLLDRLYLALDGLNSENTGKIDVIMESKQYCVMENVNGINSIAVDWITNNFFYSTKYSGIRMCDSNGLYCRRVYESNREYFEKSEIVEKLVLDPKLSLIYWISMLNSHESKRIMRSNMDGSEVQVLFDGETIGIDTASHILYTFDSDRDQMHIYNPLLKHITSTVLVTGNTASLLAMGDMIFWIDSTANTLMTSILRNIHESKIMYNSKESLHSITYNHVFFQDTGFTDPCYKLNCPYLCVTKSFAILPINVTDEIRTLTGKCVCPDDYDNAEDGTCKKFLGMNYKNSVIEQRPKMCASSMEICESEKACNNGSCKYYLNADRHIEGIACSCSDGWIGDDCEIPLEKSIYEHVIRHFTLRFIILVSNLLTLLLYKLCKKFRRSFERLFFECRNYFHLFNQTASLNVESSIREPAESTNNDNEAVVGAQSSSPIERTSAEVDNSHDRFFYETEETSPLVVGPLIREPAESTNNDNEAVVGAQSSSPLEGASIEVDNTYPRYSNEAFERMFFGYRDSHLLNETEEAASLDVKCSFREPAESINNDNEAVVEAQSSSPLERISPKVDNTHDRFFYETEETSPLVLERLIREPGESTNNDNETVVGAQSSSPPERTSTEIDYTHDRFSQLADESETDSFIVLSRNGGAEQLITGDDGSSLRSQSSSVLFRTRTEIADHTNDLLLQLTDESETDSFIVLCRNGEPV